MLSDESTHSSIVTASKKAVSYANVLTETVNGETTAYEYGLERIAAYTETDAEQVKTRYVYDVRGHVNTADR